MDSVERAPRRRTLETSNKPESGLAEWTSKIKAMQQQVDDDEEAEHKRLEEEIAASRLARMRRSTGGGSRGNSLDLSKSDVIASLKIVDATSPSGTNRTRQQNREDAMMTLNGQDASPRVHQVIQPTAAPPSGTSLAAFMGSKAVGPRLTRHAPQQNTHDPTQFEQRTHVVAPHPVFGRGGIALPGMTADLGRNLPSSSRSNVHTAKLVADRTVQRDRTINTPSGVKPVSIMTKVEERRAATPENIEPPYDGRHSARQRAMSTSVTTAPQGSPIAPVPPTKPDDSQVARVASHPASRPPAFSNASGPMGMRPTTPHEPRNVLNNSPSPQPLATSVSRSPSIPPPSPRHSSPSFKSQVSTASLSRPIQPQPRLSFGGPQLSIPSSSSASFLRPPAEKEPTPSISRLQGRGFVQSVVKASTQLSSAATASESPVPRQAGGTFENGRKASVLERWQFEGGKSDSHTPPPIISPKPVPMRRTRTFDPVHSSPVPSSPIPTPFHAESPGRLLKTTPSHPFIDSPKTPDPTSTRLASSKSDVGAVIPSPQPRAPADSSTTRTSYVKSTKNGDSPPSASSPSTPAPPPQSKFASPPAVNELGVRIRPRSKSISAAVSDEIERGPVRAPSANRDREEGKPLIHPTKDRAKKPRKARGTAMETSVGGLSRGQTAAAAPTSSQRSASIGLSPVSTLHYNTSDLTQQRLSSPPSTIARSTEFSQSLIPSSESLSPLNGRGTTSERVFQTSQRELSLVISAPPETQPPEMSAPSPRHAKHHRIPSTGNRASVMDVAQALKEHEKHVRDLSEEPIHKADTTGASAPGPSIADTPVPDTSAGQLIAHDMTTAATTSPDENMKEQNRTYSPPKIEQRKSSYEKYSAFIMPPLIEETTPVQSPVGTLARKTNPPNSPILLSHQEASLLLITDSPKLVDREETQPSRSVLQPNLTDNGSLPPVDIDDLLTPVAIIDISDTLSISVDVMSVVGSTTSTINLDQHIFYDRELLVVVHRSKAKSTGLVSTTIWSWYGKRNECGEREERKVLEIAKRYNTALIPVKQYNEPVELVMVLGGLLAIRQGTRARWARENTAMHVVRHRDGVTFIDEVDLGERNLCSGFSYCLSLLETFYVWYGQGSPDVERRAALDYAKSLATIRASVIELTEGENDDDEMFWMMLGEREYAQADYWKWRCIVPIASPRMWLLEDRTQPLTFRPISAIYANRKPHDHVYLVDCVFEYFVLVGQDSRSSRKKIQLALSAALELSLRTQESKPFVPPVHVIIFPSQIPEDLRLTFRDMDNFDSSQAPYPDHMNLLSANEAREQLQQTSWEQDLLTDTTMLPLGIHPSSL